MTGTLGRLSFGDLGRFFYMLLVRFMLLLFVINIEVGFTSKSH